MRVRNSLALLWLLAACDSESRTPSALWKQVTTKASDTTDHAEERPRGMDEAYVDRAVPLSNGAAYVSEMHNGIWYVRGDRAQRVRVIGSAQDSAVFQSVFDFDVAPTPDGRAFASSSLRKAVWLLDGAEARRVREGAPTDSVPRSSLAPASAAFWFAAYTGASTQAKKCADDAAANEQMQQDNYEQRHSGGDSYQQEQ